jgi:tetratricopeptide (TPR) repeat protein
MAWYSAATIDVATAFASAGVYDAAMRAAQTDPEPSSRIWKLAIVTDAFTAAGHTGHATKAAAVVAKLAVHAEDVEASAGAVRAVGLAGLRREAIDLAESVVEAVRSGPGKRAGRDLAHVADALAGIGEYDMAEGVIEHIESPSLVARSRARLARSLGSRDPERATRMAIAAERAVRSAVRLNAEDASLAARALCVSGRYERAAAVGLAALRAAGDEGGSGDVHGALSETAIAIARAGHHQLAATVATAALELARSVTDPNNENRVYFEPTARYKEPSLAAMGLAAAGLRQQAIDIAIEFEGVPAGRNRDSTAMINFAKSMALAGEFDHADRLIALPAEPMWQGAGLAAVARTYAEMGQREQATAAIAAAESIAGAIPEPWPAMMIDMAWAVLRLGLPEQVKPLAIAAAEAARAANYASMLRDLADAAELLFVVGEQDEAARWVTTVERLAESSDIGSVHGPVLARLAEIVEPARARVLVVESVAIARWSATLKAVARLAPDALDALVDESIGPYL